MKPTQEALREAHVYSSNNDLNLFDIVNHDSSSYSSSLLSTFSASAVGESPQELQQRLLEVIEAALTLMKDDDDLFVAEINDDNDQFHVKTYPNEAKNQQQ